VRKAGNRFVEWGPESGFGPSQPEAWEARLRSVVAPMGLVAADDTVAAAILEA
jgi:hypothetical protein